MYSGCCAGAVAVSGADAVPCRAAGVAADADARGMAMSAGECEMREGKSCGAIAKRLLESWCRERANAAAAGTHGGADAERCGRVGVRERQRKQWALAREDLKARSRGDGYGGTICAGVRRAGMFARGPDRWKRATNVFGAVAEDAICGSVRSSGAKTRALAQRSAGAGRAGVQALARAGPDSRSGVRALERKRALGRLEQ